MAKTIYKLTRGDTMMDYATLMGSYTVRFSLTLDHTIEPELMRQALDRTAARYPYLCVTARKNERELYFEQNDAPIALLHQSTPVTLGASETNRHVWAVSYEGSDLFLDFYHGRMDGTGAYALLTTLLYYYCSALYGEIDSKGIRTLEIPVTEAETRDPLDALPVIDLSSLSAPPAPSALSLLKSAPLTSYGGVGQILRIKIPERSFIPFTRANDASPGIMISVLMARAIERLHSGHADPILCNYVVNARPMLNARETHHNCTSGVTLHFDDKVRQMPLEKQCTVYRGRTFLQSDEDSVMQKMIASASVAQMIADLPTLEMKTRTAMQIAGGFYDSSTYMVSYVGKWQYPQLGAHIRAFWTATPVDPFPLIEIAAVNGDIFVSMMQSFQERDYYDAFLAELREHQIEVTECGAQPVGTAAITIGD